MTMQVTQGPAALVPAASKVPAGQAVVTDTQLPGQLLTFTGETDTQHPDLAAELHRQGILLSFWRLCRQPSIEGMPNYQYPQGSLDHRITAAAGTGQQSYVTVLTCPSSGSVINTATLLAASGQQVTAAANVRKDCHKLDVRLVEVGEPVVAR